MAKTYLLKIDQLYIKPVYAPNPEYDETELVVQCPKEWISYVLYKGNVAINGASLTVADKKEDSFSVYLIPETLNATNLSKIVNGDLLNIEIDQTTYAAVKAAEDRIKNT